MIEMQRYNSTGMRTEEYENQDTQPSHNAGNEEFDSGTKLIQKRQLEQEETLLEVPIDDPPEILKSELEMVKGLVHFEFGIYNVALDCCTKAIEQGRLFNPDIRRQCLKMVSNIFELQIKKKSNRIWTQQKDSDEYLSFEKQLTDFKSSLKVVKQMIADTELKGNKDIVFLLDCSMTMRTNLKTSMNAFLKIYDIYIKDMDRIGFIRFNHNIDTIFELQTRGKNDIFVEKFLQDAKYYECFGEKALYNALYEAIKLFSKAEPTDNSRWIVTLTDEIDTQSRIDEEKLRPLFFANNVKLIMIGIDLNRVLIGVFLKYNQQQSAKEVYSKLCKRSGGTFIESPESEDINIAFQAITNLQFATGSQATYADENFG